MHFVIYVILINLLYNFFFLVVFSISKQFTPTNHSSFSFQERTIEIDYCFQLRTPFKWLLMNLSLTELIIASSGNIILSFNSFQKRWTLYNAACQANALGMTYLGG